jgi:hypothetical protein
VRRSWGDPASSLLPSSSAPLPLRSSARQNDDVSAEQIIALEAALTELSELYSIARGFTTLAGRAEAEFLPQINAIGARLRRCLRTGELADEAIDRTATAILGLATLWRAELEALRGSPEYQRAVRAAAGDCQAELAEVIPRVLAGLHVVQPAPSLYFPVSPSSGRRRPGGSPFLSPADCADKILQLLADGIAPDAEAAEWWERELPSIACADAPAGLETPIAVCLAAADARVTVFAEADMAMFRVFTARLRAPLSIVLACDATDEWWEAYQDSYHSFRDALQEQLAARGQVVSIEGES